MGALRRFGIIAMVMPTLLPGFAAPAAAVDEEPSSSHAVAWGWNKHGQLGTGDATPAQTAFVEVGAPSQRFVKAAAGFRHSVAIAADRTVWSWGNNDHGQLGDGTTTSRSAPGQVPGLFDVVDVEAGENYSLAVRADGSVWAWGSNWAGQLGQADVHTDQPVPVQVPNLSGIVDIDAGRAHNLAVQADGSVWAWGNNASGQLGNGLLGGHVSTPRRVLGLAGVTAAAAGEEHSLVLRSHGRISAWGGNSSGQLGDGTTTRRVHPVSVPGRRFAQIAAGAQHSIGLRINGSAMAWGDNSAGQLGVGDTTARHYPTEVRFGRLTRIDAGSYFSLAQTPDLTVRAWGANGLGQLGDGTHTDRPLPVEVSGLNQALGLAAGSMSYHALAIRKTPPPSPPQVQIELGAESGSLSPGGSLTVEVGLRTISEPSKVQLSVAGLPAGVTATLDPPILMSGGSSVLTLTAVPQVTARSYTLTITATTSEHTTSATYELIVTDPVE